jgi:SAM-dependent methyltransferase
MFWQQALFCWHRSFWNRIGRAETLEGDTTMSDNESNAYILGTDREELHRLGLQHRVWATEAQRGWEEAGFTAGQTLLDLGCGPGYCTQELAFITGAEGQVIGVDQSEGFIGFAREINRLNGLNIDYHQASFDDMNLEPESLDGAWCRWALAWVSNPEDVLAKVVAGMRPGARFVVHEYYSWGVFETEPHMPALATALTAALESFGGSRGDIDVGRRLPGLFHGLGLDVERVRPMVKMALPGTLTWQWPNSFFGNYLPRLVSTGLLDPETHRSAMAEWQALERLPGASCLCPSMVEVTARKPAA